MGLKFFSLAGYLQRFILQTGGEIKYGEVLNRATMLDTLTGSVEELPGLIQARRDHSSIAIDKHLYAIGGSANGGESPWIEFLDLESKQAWQKLLQDEIVARENAAVTCLSPQKIAVFGGFHRGGRYFRNDGYILNVCTKQVTPILGKG